MPTWPGSPVDTTDVDAPGDSPANARSDIKTAIDNVNTIVAARGVASGIPSLDSDGTVPQAQLPVTPIAAGRFVDGTPHTSSWSPPAGVTKVRVTISGGGGGGGYVTPGTAGDHGGGGGAGAVVTKEYAVTNTDAFTFTVGAMGTGHGAGSDGDGADGTQTTVTSPASATPSAHTITAGAGGGGEGPPNRFGGAGGDPLSGGSPTDSTALMLPGGAGISGATRGGAGGSNAMTGGAAGGSGYGGGGGFGSGGGTPAFDGFDGFVMFEW